MRRWGPQGEHYVQNKVMFRTRSEQGRPCVGIRVFTRREREQSLGTRKSTLITHRMGWYFALEFGSLLSETNKYLLSEPPKSRLFSCSRKTERIADVQIVTW